jgi:hypothetical protein
LATLYPCLLQTTLASLVRKPQPRIMADETVCPMKQRSCADTSHSFLWSIILFLSRRHLVSSLVRKRARTCVQTSKGIRDSKIRSQIISRLYVCLTLLPPNHSPFPPKIRETKPTTARSSFCSPKESDNAIVTTTSSGFLFLVWCIVVEHYSVFCVI